MEPPQSSYREYAIRCKTCNAQVACFAEQYENRLSTGISVENTLNDMGITNYCCRIAFMNPTIVVFNMENRRLIEGMITINGANGPDNNTIESANNIFKTCRTEKKIQSNFLPPIPGLVQPHESVLPPLVSKPQIQSLVIAPLIAPGIPGDNEQGIPLDTAVGSMNSTDEINFIEPTVVGVPIINRSKYPAASIYVGAGKRATILPGRTYLAR